MPLVRAEIPAGKPVGYATSLGQAVQDAMHSAFGVPVEERFHVITEHDPSGLSIHPSYLGVPRSADAIIVQVFLNAGRDGPTKARFFAALADGLHEAIGLRREDLVVSLVEVTTTDWSFGNGQAQLMTTGDHR